MALDTLTSDVIPSVWAALAVAITTIGLVTTAFVLAKLAGLVVLYTRPSRLARYLHASPDGRPAWALVTGASDGIGKQLSHQLAAAGFNVVIHGRNPTKLAAVEAQLRAAHPRRDFRVLVADASTVACSNCRDRADVPPSQRGLDFAALAASVADLHLTVLINNAGGNPYEPIYEFVQDTREEKIANNISLNAAFPLLLASRLVPQLLDAAPALLVNVSSMSDHGMPMLSSYASSKSFVNTATRIIARELVIQGRQRDLEVMAVRVGEVCGTVQNKSKPTLFTPGAATLAKAILARVGCGRTIVSAYLPHALQDIAVNLTPGFITEKTIRDIITKRWRLEQEKAKKA